MATKGTMKNLIIFCSNVCCVVTTKTLAKTVSADQQAVFHIHSDISLQLFVFYGINKILEVSMSAYCFLTLFAHFLDKFYLELVQVGQILTLRPQMALEALTGAASRGYCFTYPVFEGD